MTQIETVTLSVMYVVPLALLGLLATTVRWSRRWLAVLVLVALPVFYTGHYFLLQAIQGWPVDRPPPDEFNLLGFDVREPAQDSAGEILIWIHSDGQPSPRAHRLPYSRELHQAIRAAGQRLSEGTPQTGRRGVAAENDDPASAGARGSTLSFHDEPPRQLPAKGGDQR